MTKQELAQLMLQDGPLYVRLIPRKFSTVLPEHLLEWDEVWLALGSILPTRVLDLDLTPQAFSGTLSLSGRLHKVYVPWTKVTHFSQKNPLRMVVWVEQGYHIRDQVERHRYESLTQKADGCKVVSLADWRKRKRKGDKP